MTVKEMAEYLGCSRDTIERRLKKCDELVLQDGVISRRNSS
jgi:transcriptional antiterminator